MNQALYAHMNNKRKMKKKQKKLFLQKKKKKGLCSHSVEAKVNNIT
jgi:hypothetical protein